MTITFDQNLIYRCVSLFPLHPNVPALLHARYHSAVGNDSAMLQSIFVESCYSHMATENQQANRLGSEQSAKSMTGKAFPKLSLVFIDFSVILVLCHILIHFAMLPERVLFWILWLLCVNDTTSVSLRI